MEVVGQKLANAMEKRPSYLGVVLSEEDAWFDDLMEECDYDILVQH